jgi:hypothetical protein
MAAAAEIAYGTPVNLHLGGAYADLGAECRDGQPVIMLALDDGNGFTTAELTPERAELLADCLRGLARIGRDR